MIFEIMCLLLNIKCYNTATKTIATSHSLRDSLHKSVEKYVVCTAGTRNNEKFFVNFHSNLTDF